MVTDFHNNDIKDTEPNSQGLPGAGENPSWDELCLNYKKLWHESLEEATLVKYGPQPKDTLIGWAPSLRELLVSIRKVAPTKAIVLLEGESGTGKGTVAKAICGLSQRNKHSFIPVNCAAIPGTLFESTMFGHVKGAFTGAEKEQVGKVQLADGGTLFLDQIGDTEPCCQSKLLHAVEEDEIWQVGAEKAISVDVRIIAATDRPLRELVREGKFRGDLYQRLRMVHITVPSLRHRREDILVLARFFISLFSLQENRHQIKRISKECERTLQEHSWLYNVRELRNVMYQAVIFASGPSLRSTDIVLEPAEETAEANDCFELQLYKASSTDSQKSLVENLKRIAQRATPQDWPHMGGIIEEEFRISRRQAQRYLKALKSAGWPYLK